MAKNQERDNAFDMQVKLLMIGDSGVGKTCMLLRYANDSFSPTFITTIGIDFKIKNVQIDGKRLKSQIWDTAGQERFRTITTSYFRGAQGIMIVYDVTDRNSFIGARNWFAQIQMHADVNVNRILIGNKSDCNDQRSVSLEEGEALACEYGCHFFEVSSKYDNNIEKAFRQITEDVKNRLIMESYQPSELKKGFLGHFMTIKESFKMRVPKGNADLRVELSIQGAKSWYNMHMINGRYIPNHEYYHVYNNVDSLHSTLVYTKKHWVVMKHKKVLAAIKSVDAIPPIFDSNCSEVWYENYGIMLTRMYQQPTLTCTKLDLEKERTRESIAVRGEINLETFFECCEEPERLGLTIPLFVSYSRVKMAIAELDYANNRAELNMDKMGQLQEERRKIEERCWKLLSTVGKDIIKHEPLAEFASTLESVLPALTVLVEQVKGYFEEMCDLHRGNLEVARKCRDTLTELDGDLQRLLGNVAGGCSGGGKQGHTKTAESEVDAGKEAGVAAEEASSPVSSSGEESEAPLSHTSGSIAAVQSAPATTRASTSDAAVLDHLATRVVHSAKKDWTCTIVRVGWVAVHESENSTNSEIDFRCLISSGIMETQSTKVAGALTAGMSHICASVGLDKSWSSSATSRCEREHHVKITPHTKLTIEQEVVEGHITFGKTLFSSKGKEKHFRVAKDSLRIRTCPIPVV